MKGGGGLKSYEFRDEADMKHQTGNTIGSKKARKECKILRRSIKHSENNKVRKEIETEKK